MGRNPEQNRQQRERTRARVLQAALQLFAERGLHGTSMAAVAERAGVGKGTVFHHFAGRSDLVRAVLEQRQQELRELVGQLPPQASPSETLRAFARAVARSVDADPSSFAVYLRALTDPAMRAEIRDLEPDRTPWPQVFTDLGSPDPETDARFFQAALLGILTQRVVSPVPPPLEPLVERLLDLTLGETP